MTKLTGVGGVFCAAHRSPAGVLHGHSYEVVAWFERTDARDLQEELAAELAALDHSCLPDELAWGEEIAEQIGLKLGCVRVEVSRPLERIYANWERA